MVCCYSIRCRKEGWCTVLVVEKDTWCVDDGGSDVFVASSLQCLYSMVCVLPSAKCRLHLCNNARRHELIEGGLGISKLIAQSHSLIVQRCAPA